MILPQYALSRTCLTLHKFRLIIKVNLIQDRLIARPAEDEYFNMLGDHETEGIELKYAPGEKELQQMLEMLAATKGRPGREPKNKGRPCRKPKTVKTETVTESVYFAPVSIQPLDLTQANLVTVKLEEKED